MRSKGWGHGGQRDVTLGQADWNRILLSWLLFIMEVTLNPPCPPQCAHRDDEPVLLHFSSL